MRIVFLTSATTSSGGARQALYLAEGLAGRGHAITFFTPREATVRGLSDNMRWADLPASPGGWRAALEAVMPAPGTAPCIVQAFHNKAVKRLSWYGLFWRRRGVVCAGYRGVVYRPGNPLPYWSPGLDAFVANSRACAGVLRGMGVGERRIAVIHNGIPAARLVPHRPAATVREELALSPDSPVLGCVTNDGAVKGVAPLLRAFARACARGDAAPGDDGSRLVVVGVSPDRWRPLCAELGIAARVRLVEHSNRVADYLQVFDVFVLPSLSESMPNTLLEAICTGLPVVATRVGGVPDLVRQNGLLVPPGDVDALAAALHEALSRPERRAAWAAGSRAMAPEFSTDIRVNRFEALYRALLRKRGLSND